MEDYAAKMALKTDMALRDYVTGYGQYREEAVLAALTELRQRGQPAPEEATLRPQLEAVVQEAQATAQKVAAEPEAAELPQLYSPAGIVVISATISVVAGAILLAINMYRLKRGNAILGLMAFVAAYLVGETLLLRWLMAQHLLSAWATLFLDLPLIMAFVWWFWPRYVGKYQFQPRNWYLPLLGCLLLKFGLYYAVMHNPETAKIMQQQMEQLQQK